MHNWCGETNLSLSIEKSNFMIQEEIALGHKISFNALEIDRPMIDVIEKLMPPSTYIKRVRIFPRHARSYKMFVKKISRSLYIWLEKDVKIEFNK